MLTEYIDKAMHLAEYEVIEDDGTYFGSIPDFQGLWANGKTLEECRDELKSTLEDWLILGLWQNDTSLPVLGKLSLVPRRVRLPREHRSSKERGPSTPSRSRKAS
jgi:predicted RNase H-like HicB family nuclease